ncbi:MAG: glycoside hydrolase family 19 protein [Pseudanabaenaceae cyanobacterium]
MNRSEQLGQWRQQAAASLRFLVPKIGGTTATPQDEAVDDLVRMLRNLPARPASRPPYAGLFPPASLSVWRQQAAELLFTLVPGLPIGEEHPLDAEIDDALRALSRLPPRPPNRPPYMGLFPPGTPTQWRQQAGDRLLQLLTGLTGNLGPQDEIADSLLRSLRGLPLRPLGRRPYEGLLNGGTLTEQRQFVGQQLQRLVRDLTGGELPVDAQIDRTLRLLNGLPPRPVGQPPYVGLYPTATPDLLTQDQLQAIAPATPAARLAQFLPPLNRTLREYQIDTPLRIAHFLAQIAHESDGFRATEEYASGAAYEGRLDLGNTQPGDGRRFKGRGLIQVTGRANYIEASRALGVDLLADPTRLAEVDLATRSAGWFWHSRRLNAHADRDDIHTITRRINGGYNGLADRQSYLNRAKQALG